MRIAYVIDSLATGGAERLVVDLAMEAARRGHDVSIVTISDRRGVPLKDALDANLNVHTLGLAPRDPRAIRGIRRLTRDADIVHVHLFPALYWSAFVSKPIIFTEHSTRNVRQDHWAFAFLERAIYARYSAVIAITDGVQSSLQAHFKKWGIRTPIKVFNNGIRRVFFRSGDRVYPELKVLRLVAIGSLTEVKCFSNAIRAVAQCNEVCLDIIGEGPLRKTLEDIITGVGLSGRVRLLGERGDISELLKEYDALISTSTYEGFGLVAVEAMATGAPVIGPDVPGFNNVVIGNSTGLLYDPKDGLAAIVEAIKAMRSATLRHRLGVNATVHARKFSIEDSFALHEKLYTEVLTGSDPCDEVGEKYWRK
jgi:glycosyltransferase involved in cell wall biosynthesis